MLNVPWSWKPLPVYGFQVIATLSRVMDDPVRSFPYAAEFPLGRVSSCWGDLAQDEVSYVESSELYPLVIVFDHLLLVLFHFIGIFLSDFVQTVQVDS